MQRGLSRSLHLSVCLSPLLSLCSPELHIHTQAPFSVVFASGCVLPSNQSSIKDEMHRWQAVIKHYVCVFLNTAKPQQPDLDSFHLVQLEQRGAISHIGESKWQREGAVKSFDNLNAPKIWNLISVNSVIPRPYTLASMRLLSVKEVKGFKYVEESNRF